MMPTSGCRTRSPAADLSRRLAENAEAVCRHYLSNGRRQGRYWIVGDAMNSRGESMFVRLHGPSSGKGAAGKWTDGSSGEHGDLLDLIRLNQGHLSLRATFEEARSFLSLPRPAEPEPRRSAPDPAPRHSPDAARRLFRAGIAVRDTPGAVYLASRGLAHAIALPALRFHPRCYHRPSDDGPTLQCPALLAAVTSIDGQITGVNRTWLAPDGSAKADLADPRRALGNLLGSGVRIAGGVSDVLVVGEGLETVLSLRRVLPRLPVTAGLSANHLSALVLPAGLRRLYVARDNDRAGERAVEALHARAAAEGIPEVRELVPAGEDFNADLTALGPDGLAAHISPQLDGEDRVRHLHVRLIEASAA